MKKRILYIILLLGYLPAFAQVGPSWRPAERTKKWFTDSIYVAKDARFNSTLRINESALRIGLVTVTANGTELNILDGALVSTTELNRLVGVTSGIQTQLNSKAPSNSPAFTGNVPTTEGIPLSRAASVTSNISAGVLTDVSLSITTEPYNIQLFSSGGSNLTGSIADSVALSGGTYHLYLYSVDAMSNVKIKFLY